MSEISAVAEAVAVLGNIYLAHLNPGQQTRIREASLAAQSDMRAFCDAVRGGDVGTCNLLLNGLRRSGPLPELTAGEVDELERVNPGIDGATLANLYCLAREGDFAACVREIVATSGSGNNNQPAGTANG